MAEARIETDEAGNRYKVRGSHRRLLPSDEVLAQRTVPKVKYSSCPVDLRSGDVHVPSGKPALVDSWTAPCRCSVSGLTMRVNDLDGVERVNGLIQLGDKELHAFSATTGLTTLFKNPISMQQFEQLSIFIETEFPQPCVARNVRVQFIFDNRGAARD
jgi:hypothetical protein